MLMLRMSSWPRKGKYTIFGSNDKVKVKIKIPILNFKRQKIKVKKDVNTIIVRSYFFSSMIIFRQDKNEMFC